MGQRTGQNLAAHLDLGSSRCSPTARTTILSKVSPKLTRKSKRTAPSSGLTVVGALSTQTGPGFTKRGSFIQLYQGRARWILDLRQPDLVDKTPCIGQVVADTHSRD